MSYTERQKDLAKTVMANVVPIAIMMFLLMVGGVCFAKAGDFAADLTQRRLLLLVHFLIVIIQAVMVWLLFWSRKVVRSEQGKL
uniref:Uncharacterized protein n=1 Tax=Pseudomonas phage HRDY3 TaxID=3236930 RepID=A0AB39CDR6_9VIRU